MAQSLAEISQKASLLTGKSVSQWMKNTPEGNWSDMPQDLILAKNKLIAMAYLVGAKDTSSDIESLQGRRKQPLENSLDRSLSYRIDIQLDDAAGRYSALMNRSLEQLYMPMDWAATVDPSTIVVGRVREALRQERGVVLAPQIFPGRR